MPEIARGPALPSGWVSRARDDESGAIGDLFAAHSLREGGHARQLGIGGVLAALGKRPVAAPRLGPFELRKELGRGGMGIVYGAHDTRLQRQVAVKVLREDLSGDDRDAILREARSLAQLSHPHVVEVFATGVDHGQAWVAMELVEGGTLSDWAARQPDDPARRQSAALAMVRDMGRGLAAAHARGIVHRDIKPGNVLVGKDGRLRIVDFGLARNPVDSQATDPTGRGLRIRGDMGSNSTLTDAVVGTPRYMAPEQHEGRRCTPASDQYAWALTAWELLVGKFPFAGGTIFALHEAKARGRPAVPRSTPVSGRILRVLARALDPDPQRRFGSMRAAVQALSPPSRGRSVAWLGAAGVVGVAALAWPSAEAGPPGCDRSTSVERMEAVWDPARRERVHDAVRRARLEYAPATTAAIDGALDSFGQRWVDEHVAACRATWQERTARAEDLDARSACLRRQLTVVDRFAGRLEGDDVGVFEHVVTAVGKLPDPSLCAETSSTAPAVRSEELSDRLAAAKAAQMVGDVALAMELATSIAEQARIEDDAVAQSEALEVVAGLAYAQRDTAVAVEAAAEGYALAMASDDTRRAAVHARYAAMAAADAHQAEEAQRWLRHLEATHGRYTPTALEQAAAERTAAQVAWSLSDFETAQRHSARALELSADDESARARTFRVAVLGQMATIVAALGRTDEAETLGEQVLAQLEEIYGPDHPRVAGRYHELAIEAIKRGQAELAAQRFGRAHEIFAATHGPKGQRTFASATGLSVAKRHLGDLEEGGDTARGGGRPRAPGTRELLDQGAHESRRDPRGPGAARSRTVVVVRGTSDGRRRPRAERPPSRSQSRRDRLGPAQAWPIRRGIGPRRSEAVAVS